MRFFVRVSFAGQRGFAH